ncbi:MAG TPA: alkaline phosphatase family protein [Solirubrobacteraceae bacterium]|jgi:DNA-binding beta-propeller fold protein YncE
MTRRRPIAAAVLVAVCATTAAAVGEVTSRDAVGPAVKTTVNGRRLDPYGKLVAVGNFPTGAAATPDGRFYWTVSTGRGRNDIRIVDVASGAVVQTLPIPGASGGIAMDPSAPVAYVSGVADSSHEDQKSPDGTPGVGGDVVHVLRYDAATGQATFDRLIAVPPPSDAPPAQDFPPGSKRLSWPDRLAVSPDGKTLLVPLNLAGAAAVVDTASGTARNVKTGSYPYGAAILADGKTGLVSNEASGTVSVVDLAAASKVKDITVGPHLSHPESIAVDPGAPRAYVPLANSDQVAVIDTQKLDVARTLSVGRPEGLGTSPVDTAVTPDGGRLLVAQSGADAISVFALPGHPATGGGGKRVIAVRSVRSIARYRRRHVAAHRALRRALRRTSPPRRRSALRRRYAARLRTLRRRLVYGRARTACAGPTNAQERRYIAAVLRALARRARASRRRRAAAARRYAKAVRAARRRLPRVRACGSPGAPGPGDFERVGAIPTASQPMAVAATAGGRLLYLSAKGLGTGANPGGPRPDRPEDTDDAINSTQYLPLLVAGMASIGTMPSDTEVGRLTPVADDQVRPVNAAEPPAGTPLRKGGPIKHVFYIVRENRTYDQVLGDDARGDGDPKLTLFGDEVTPNAHALARRFPLLDHVYANSEASIDGHFWTSAATVPDYVNKNWWQNYAARGRPYDFPVYAVDWPQNGFLLDQAERQGISYFDYGEAIAGNIALPDEDRTPEETQQVTTKFSHSDIQPTGPGSAGPSCYPNDGSVGVDVVTRLPVFDTQPPTGAPPQNESRFACFKQHFQQQLATGDVPTFNYMVLSNDHTRVLTAGAYTPRAMVADNDEGLGRIVDLISHSPIWSSSAIFVIEDDSQDGADHVDAHRIPAFVISPYAKRGAVIHTRYDFPSVIRSLELAIGMKPLGFQDALGTPMYDAFDAEPTNAEPYTFAPSKVDLLEKNPATGPGARESAGLPRGLDRIPQHEMDRLLWKSVHGWRSTPPPPGPNAEPGE